MRSTSGQLWRVAGAIAAACVLGATAAFADPLSSPHSKEVGDRTAADNPKAAVDRRISEPLKLTVHAPGGVEGTAGDSSECSLRLEELWTADVGAPIYATPIIVPKHTGGGQSIIVPTLVHDVAALDVATGLPPEGWPVSFEGSHFHASAAVHDVDGDGVQDVCAVSAEGHIFWIQMGAQGRYLSDYHVRVPTLRVRRDWYEGLDAESPENLSELTFFDHRGQRPLVKDSAGKPAGDVEVAEPEQNAQQLPEAQELQHLQHHHQQQQQQQDVSEQQPAKRRRLQAISEVNEEVEVDPGVEADVNAASDGADGEEDQWNAGYDDWKAAYGDVYTSAYMGDDLMAGYWDAAYGGMPPHLRRGGGGGAANATSAYVHVDAHCLAPPTMADVDGDGSAEMIIAVSYFFDRRQYEGGRGLPEGVRPEKYVGGGLLAFDFALQDWLWTVHLDLTTDETRHRAYIYASPTVADLDGDGHLEVVVGTAMGLVYALDAESGEVRKGFPVQFGEIQAQVAVADIAGDTGLELIVGDTQGNVAVLDAEGHEVWHRRTSGAMTNAAVVGDVDGDGQLDVVIAVTSPDGEGHLYAMDAATGRDLDGWPLRLGRSADGAGPEGGRGSGGLSGAPLLVDLHAGGAAADGGGSGGRRGLHVVVPSLDGHVYVVEGLTRCTRRTDIGRFGEGEHMYAQVLAADVSGELALLLSTMSGTVTALGAGVAAHPLNTWDGPVRGGHNGFVHGSHAGVFISSVTASYSRTLDIEFEIRDDAASSAQPEGRKYTAEIHLGNSGETLFVQAYSAPGTYTAAVPMTKPLNAAVTLTVTTDNGLQFRDSAEVEYMTGFPVLLASLVCVPVAFAAAQLLLFSKAVAS